MEMFLKVVLLLVGFAFLIKGADFLVEGASSFAKKMGISEIVIGLTIVAFGTSMPELIVNVMGAISGNSEIAYGNIIGSNILNILLIAGVAAVISPIVVKKKTAFVEIPFALGVALLFFILVNDKMVYGGENLFSRGDAIILLTVFAGFLFYVFKTAKSGPKKEEKMEEDSEVKILGNKKTVIFILLGFLGLFVGGKLIVDSAVFIAGAMGVSQKLIGLTIVALGTSMPELVTSSVAAYKGRNDIAIGNVVGSNIFNILLIMGVSGVITPMKYMPELFNFDMYTLIGASILLFLTMFTMGKKIVDRIEGFAFLGLYVIYTVRLIIVG
jgi:cation:H+ antiporter